MLPRAPPVPCRPYNVRTTMPQCPTSLAWVAWEHANGAQSYAVKAVTGGGGGGVVSCNATAATSCQLRALLCGHTYNVSLVARDDSCDSMESEVAQLNTGNNLPTSLGLCGCDGLRHSRERFKGLRILKVTGVSVISRNKQFWKSAVTSGRVHQPTQRTVANVAHLSGIHLGEHAHL